MASKLLPIVSALMQRHGIPNTLSATEITYTIADGRTAKVILDSDTDWDAHYSKFLKARSSSFEGQTFTSVLNGSVEFRLSLISQSFLTMDDTYSFEDKIGNTVTIARSSEHYALNFFLSEIYDSYFQLRLLDRLRTGGVTRRRLSFFLPRFITAKYTRKGKKIPASLVDDARKQINRALVKLAIEQGQAISLWKERKGLPLVSSGSTLSSNLPEVDYNEDAISYYKIGLSSLFPSQGFLAYYHVCEYFFLTTQEVTLHARISTIINDIKFKPNQGNLEKIILTVRNQDARADESEMLRAVMARYVDESDLIDFINQQEKRIGRNFFTKRQRIFGEEVHINNQSGHALPNTARVLKHVRNAIVHSSDRYKREDCHVPLSDTEDTIAEFVPLVKFVAEKVIFGTATP